MFARPSIVGAMKTRTPDITDNELVAHVRLARTGRVGPVAFRKLLNLHGSAAQAIEALLDSPNARMVLGTERAKAELTAAYDAGASVLTLGEEPYPATLAAIDDAPPLLYLLGDPNLMTRRCIAMVGARNASGAGLKLARSLAEGLSEAGFVVVSGLARGIDTAAHQASVNGGTIACVAGGLDVVYPQENKALHHEIATQGLIVSEMPPGTKPQARHFPRRNRLISGLSLGTVIIEAAAKSGSLITARFAGEQGRELFAVPGSPLDPRSAGANQLIKDGAVLVRNAQDILDELPDFAPFKAQPASKMSSKTNKIALPAATQSSKGDLQQLLSPSPLHVDELVLLSGRATDQILAELQLLEIDGKVLRHAGNRFSLNA